jgi:hypothetical protein
VPPGVTGNEETSTIPPAPPPPELLLLAPPPPPTTKTLTDETPAGTLKVNAPFDVNDSTTGALTVILNCLVDVDAVVAAETVNVDVVFETTPVAVPEITPVDESIERPGGKAPTEIEYVIVSPSASVAAAVESV